MTQSKLFTLLAVALSAGSSLAKANSHTIAAAAGAAAIPHTNHTVYGYGVASYLRRSHGLMGWSGEVGGGPKGAYRLLAAGVDVYLWQGLRVGAGAGFAFPTNEIQGNAILLPIPEATLGYVGSVGSDGKWRPVAQVTQNIFLGTRASVGMGFAL